MNAAGDNEGLLQAGKIIRGLVGGAFESLSTGYGEYSPYCSGVGNNQRTLQPGEYGLSTDCGDYNRYYSRVGKMSVELEAGECVV